MAIGDKFKVHVLYRNNALNLTAENGLAFTQLSEEVSETAPMDLVDRFRAEVEAELKECFQNTWFIEGYRVTTLPGHLVTYETAIVPVLGTMSGDPLPPQVAGIVSVRTAGTGKSSRGRFYLPPAAESANTSEGLVAGTHLTAVQDVVTALLGMSDTSIAYAEWEWGVWSEKHQTIAPVINGIARNKWGTIRGRTR